MLGVDIARHCNAKCFGNPFDRHANYSALRRDVQLYLHFIEILLQYVSLNRHNSHEFGNPVKHPAGLGQQTA
jgi:hypothetical protein